MRSRRWFKAGRLLPLVALLVTVLDALAKRRRLAALPVLPVVPRQRTARSEVDGSVAPMRLVRAEGVEVDQVTESGARALAEREGLSVVNLVPRDLPTAQALDLLHDIDPRTYRQDRQAKGHGGGHAVLAEERLLGAVGLARRGVPSAVELARAEKELKPHAAARTQVVLAPRLWSSPSVLAQDAEVLRVRHGMQLNPDLATALTIPGLIVASGLFSPGLAFAALAAWSAHPVMVFAGNKNLKPADLWAYSLQRLVREPRRLVAALRADAAHKANGVDPVEQRRAQYRADLEGGLERFFERERTDCPWCGGGELKVRLRSGDLNQGKPGEFRVDECLACGHVFTNPQPTAEGLGFYYRDAYDGLNEDMIQGIFATRRGYFQPQAETVRPYVTPRTWLDVGTGHGHFCNAAKEIWPQTSFHGLDMSEGVPIAERRGWIDRGYRGMFVDLAPSMPDRYDVVSMFHYLEHAKDPHQELEAATKVLRPGGYLLIDVPDPACRWAGLLGKWWSIWLQPQHLHFFPVENLRKRLTELGYTVVLEQHAEAHQPADLLTSAWMAVRAVAPERDVPWRPEPPSTLRRVARGVTFAAGTPLMAAGALVDTALSGVAEKYGLCNSYRLLARKD
ncbi:class I SAM-dependent methyltransferase [Allokutzneria oryzae]|uniref:Methyltransferase domain-containing protein n=1 Tax=Allokutzneria oryzae TaxID=1378989 RepID=A0ABV6A8D6_9PSEU